MSQNNLELLGNNDGTIALNYWDSRCGDDICLKFKDGKWLLSNYDADKDELFYTECDLVTELRRALEIQNKCR